MRLRQGEWRLEDAPGGWLLRYRCSLNAFDYAPSSLPAGANRWFWVAAMLLPAISAGWLTLSGVHPIATVCLSAILEAWLFAVWFLPHRLSPLLGTPYLHAVSQRTVECVHGKFTVAEGMFDVELLSTLRSAPVPKRQGRALLVFDGHFDSGIPLVLWPGFAEQQVTAMRAAVLDRVSSSGVGRNLSSSAKCNASADESVYLACT